MVESFGGLVHVGLQWWSVEVKRDPLYSMGVGCGWCQAPKVGDLVPCEGRAPLCQGLAL